MINGNFIVEIYQVEGLFAGGGGRSVVQSRGGRAKKKGK
jgi:hypothetical protein